MTLFAVVAAPSRSRPQLKLSMVKADVLLLQHRLGGFGMGGLTEITRKGPKAAVRALFPGRQGLSRTDCPAVWTGFEKVEGGVDFGCIGIPIVAPARYTSWAILKDADGLEYAIVSTHMSPGGWAHRPSTAQARVRHVIQFRWRRHSRHISRRLAELNARCEGRVAMVGDINRPGLTTWAGMQRVSEPGLLYIGLGYGLELRSIEYRKQNADHPAGIAIVTLKEH
ncbi:hypothetical protein GCM10028801_30790 [Nocardioides maradonensis]